jgi:hypothetical protein
MLLRIYEYVHADIQSQSGCPADSCVASLDLVSRTLSASSSAPSIPTHRHALLQLLHILEILDRALNLPAVDGLRSLAGVLEADTQVRAPRASGLRRCDVLGCVADHLIGVDRRWVLERRMCGRGLQW